MFSFYKTRNVRNLYGKWKIDNWTFLIEFRFLGSDNGSSYYFKQFKLLLTNYLFYLRAILGNITAKYTEFKNFSADFFFVDLTFYFYISLWGLCNFCVKGRKTIKKILFFWKNNSTMFLLMFHNQMFPRIVNLHEELKKLFKWI